MASEEIRLTHRLESVKILPPEGQNQPDLYGALSAMATSLVEVEAPGRPRVFSMAVTAPQFSDGGQPTSWSAAIDALASGRRFDASSQGLELFEQEADAQRRLFVISAGNVPHKRVADAGVDYMDRCDVEVVQDPGQAWNALTVGAHTEKVHLADADWEGYQPLAPEGDLCPWSCTGVAFEKEWPNKPEIVMEGGNAMLSPIDEVDFGCQELDLLTTIRPSEGKQQWYGPTRATSAACAQAARMAATISEAYPNLWPEAIRALMVHSARWTAQMRRHLPKKPTKSDLKLILHRYGYGVPQLSRALHSARDALTLIAQDRIQPYGKKQGAMKMRHLHLYALPWPRDALLDLGEQEVELRVTLSYFIEPNPGRMGWRQRHRYASTRLRFDVKRPTDSLDVFEKRLNQAALDDEETKPEPSGDAHRWTIGSRVRERGSLHSDCFTATGAELAECGLVGVYPVGGWWKDQPKRARPDASVPYALIISIETAATEVDLWTPVQQMLEAKVPVEAV